MAGPSSTPSSVFRSKEYDVFISFRGEDTRDNFTSHLRDALHRNQIKAYIDDKLKRGDEILPSLFEAIEKSLISIIIFSEHYASSRWCLDELLKILECRNIMEQDVIPVFYRVDPSHVRKLKRSYDEAFAKHEPNFDQDRLNKWKQALFVAANLAGWDSQKCGDESELIQKIVQDVLQKLERKCPPKHSNCPFGMNENLAPIESLLSHAQSIGLWGMGGIGKTTIARWLWQKHSSEFEGSCFLENIREKSGDHGQKLNDLRNELVSKLLEDDDVNMRTTTRESTFDEKRLSRKRVFIVLDDVSTPKQLDYLVGEDLSFGSGSRIIITTRDKHVLSGRVDAIHKVEELNRQESLQLFSLKAFKKSHPVVGYEVLSTRVVNYTKGIPLALEVLGSFLRSKNAHEWASALGKLERIPHDEIQHVLRLSYDGLNDAEQEIFLDIACFLKGEQREHVVRLIDSCNFYADIGLRTLQDNALITIENKVVWMHDLIQEMGWEIVRQQAIKQPGKRSRLWDPKEVYDVLKHNKGTEEVECIILDMSQIRDLHLNVDPFKKMTNLRFHKFHSPRGVKYSSVNLPTETLELFSDELRYLEWNGCLSKSLPLTFCPEKLVELIMPDSHFEKLWDGMQDLLSLKRIDFSGSKWLKELPDFSNASKLEDVDLSYCESLSHVHQSILSSPTLVNLYLTGCKELKSLEIETHLRSLRNIRVNGCSSLEVFSVSSDEIRDLDLSSTIIKELDSSFGSLSRLDSLSLKGLTLKNLPEFSSLENLLKLDLSCCFGQVLHKQKLQISFSGLQSLTSLSLDHCRDLIELPDNVSVLSSLIQLSLSGSSIKCLPASIKQLTGLRSLHLRDCNELQFLPQLPESLTHLDATNCTSLETIRISRTSRLSKETNEYVLLQNCTNLEERLMSAFMKDIHFSLEKTAYEIGSQQRFDHHLNSGDGTAYKFHICFPGSAVPIWFKYGIGASITTTVPPPSEIFGFVFCVVISSSPSNEDDCTVIEFRCYGEDGKEFGRGKAEWHDAVATKLNADHVYLWYDPVFCYHIFKGIKESTTSSPEVLFEFIGKSRKRYIQFGKPRTPDNFISITKCGVRLIYFCEPEPKPEPKPRLVNIVGCS